MQLAIFLRCMWEGCSEQGLHQLGSERCNEDETACTYSEGKESQFCRALCDWD